MKNVNQGNTALNQVRPKFTFIHVDILVIESLCQQLLIKAWINTKTEAELHLNFLSPLVHWCFLFLFFYCQIQMRLPIFHRPCYYCISIVIIIWFVSFDDLMSTSEFTSNNNIIWKGFWPVPLLFLFNILTLMLLSEQTQTHRSERCTFTAAQHSVFM